MSAAYLEPLVTGRSASFAFLAHASQNSCALMSVTRYVDYIASRDPKSLS